MERLLESKWFVWWCKVTGVLVVLVLAAQVFAHWYPILRILSR